MAVSTSTSPNASVRGRPTFTASSRTKLRPSGLGRRLDRDDALAVAGGLDPVLAGVHAVGLGLEAVEGRLGALEPRGVTTSRRAVARIDQIGAVPRAQIAVPGRQLAVDAREEALARRVVDRDVLRLLVTKMRRRVPRPRRGVPVAGSHVARQGGAEDPVDLDVALGTRAVPLLGHRVPHIRTPVPALGRGVPLVGPPVALVRSPLTLANQPFSLTHLSLRGVLHPGRRVA